MLCQSSPEIVSHFITEIEQNPRLEVLIQAQSVFIENDDVNKLRFSRDWNQHKQGKVVNFNEHFITYFSQ